MGLRLCAVVLAACSGGKAKAVEDAKHAPPKADATPSPPPALVHGYRVDTAAKTGDVQVRVEWKDVPLAMRAPGPVTACGTPRAAALVPTTTWGVPDVLVVVDVDHGKAFEPSTARIVIEDCELSPRTVVAGATLAIASAMQEPVTVAITEVARPLAGAPLAGKPRTVYLPITGHEVEAALEPDTVYTVAYGTGDVAAVVRATTPYVAVTDPSGQVVMRDVPVGTHPVRAWLLARNGGESRTATGTITVTAGVLADITLDISHP